MATVQEIVGVVATTAVFTHVHFLVVGDIIVFTHTLQLIWFQLGFFHATVDQRHHLFHHSTAWAAFHLLWWEHNVNSVQCSEKLRPFIIVEIDVHAEHITMSLVRVVETNITTIFKLNNVDFLVVRQLEVVSFCPEQWNVRTKFVPSSERQRNEAFATYELNAKSKGPIGVDLQLQVVVQLKFYNNNKIQFLLNALSSFC